MYTIMSSINCFKKAKQCDNVYSVLPIHGDRVGNMKKHIHTIYIHTHTHFFSKLIMVIASREENGVMGTRGRKEAYTLYILLYHLNSVQ